MRRSCSLNSCLSLRYAFTHACLYSFLLRSVGRHFTLSYRTFLRFQRRSSSLVTCAPQRLLLFFVWTTQGSLMALFACCYVPWTSVYCVLSLSLLRIAASLSPGSLSDTSYSNPTVFFSSLDCSRVFAILLGRLSAST